MQQHYIISYIGVDRPGLVDQISQIIHEIGGSWQSSRSANLSGMFSGMVHVSLDQSNEASLSEAVSDLQSESMQISVTPVNAIGSSPEALLEVKVVGADRKGIVREVSSILSSLGINLEALETQVAPAPMSGEPTFSAIAEVSIPKNLDIDRLRDALEQLSDDLIVEIRKI